MIYQVKANLFFEKEDEARDFFHDCEVAYPKGISVNPDGEDAEFSIVELIENHHDTDPNEPCVLLDILATEP